MPNSPENEPENAACRPCGACGVAGQRKLHRAREMMFGTRHEFTYAECETCGALELVSPPADMGAYYPTNYYSLTQQPIVDGRRAKVEAVVLAAILASRGAAWPLIYRMTAPWWRTRIHLRERLLAARGLAVCGARRNSAILDVGCGNGRMMIALESAGLRSLTGIDPYFDSPGLVGKSCRVLQQTIYEHEGTYDVVMMNHSFEHMDNPASVLREAHRLVKPGGRVLIRIPVADSWAWRTYGTDWFQLDAPRHLFLHTRRSLDALGAQTLFAVEAEARESSHVQFSVSELYRQNIALNEKDPLAHFTKAQMSEFWDRAAKLDRSREGDQAAFVLRRIG